VRESLKLLGPARSEPSCDGIASGGSLSSRYAVENTSLDRRPGLTMKDLLRRRRDLLRRYGLAVACAGLALLLRGALPFREGLSIYQFPVAAVVVSAWYGGRGPGWLALLICATSILYWLIPPPDSFSLPPDHVLGLCVFVFLGLLLTEFSVGRRRAEHAMEESDRRFRLMAETVPEVLCFESIAPRRMLYMSPRYEQIWGRPVGDLERDPDAWIDAVHPEDKGDVSSAQKRWLAGEGSGRLDVTFRIVRPDGATRWIHRRGTVICDEQGRPYRASGLTEDVTEEKRAEEALAQVKSDLAHVTRVTTMGQLAASIAHEVNQPLAAVATNGNACLRWLAREPPNLDEAREAAARIVRDANRAAEVVANVRALTRKTPARKDWVNVNDTIGEVMTLTRVEAQKGRVALRTQLSPDVPPVLADKVQLQQVLLNLVVNGIEAMSGAVAEPRDLVIGSAKDVTNDVLVTVRDSGAGLDAGTADRLFDPFYTTKPGGMGMGLAISRSIIESHGGRIWAAPNTPRGAVFHFTLPAGALS
jgi:PAS domain S-box-containing protein